MERQKLFYDGYGVNYGDYYYNPPAIQKPAGRRMTLAGAVGAAANKQIFIRHRSPGRSRSPRRSPGRSPGRSPRRSSTRRSPRRSPRRSSPRRSPRKSPGRSPRRKRFSSPEHARQLEMVRHNEKLTSNTGGSIYETRKSPKKYNHKTELVLKNAEKMGVDPEYVKRF